MSNPTISAYFSAFNLVQNGFDYETALRRALAFFDEVVVAVNTSTDDTLDALRAFANTDMRLKVISTDLSYTDVTFDGRVKDAALQACTGDVLVQLDLDEFVPLNQRALWRTLATDLLAYHAADCFMIPTIDLWGSMDTVRADVPFGTKMRMHKRGLYRGVWKEAWITYGRQFDPSRSDSGELIDREGNLARAVPVVHPRLLHPSVTQMLNGYPYTVHTGYASFDQRVRVNKAIWAAHWTLRNNGREANVAVDKAPLLDYPVIKHNLDLT